MGVHVRTNIKCGLKETVLHTQILLNYYGLKKFGEGDIWSYYNKDDIQVDDE